VGGNQGVYKFGISLQENKTLGAETAMDVAAVATGILDTGMSEFLTDQFAQGVTSNEY
jgi:hypothetical protein